MSRPSEQYQNLYQAGVEAARTGDRDGARRFLRAAITLDGRQKKAWLALAHIETDPAKKARCYELVLKLDPHDPIAGAYLAGMRHANRANPRVSWALAGGILVIVAALVGVLVLLIQPPRNADVLPTAAVLPSITPDLPGASVRDLSQQTAEVVASVTPTLTDTSIPTTEAATATVRFAVATSTNASTAAPTSTPTPTATSTATPTATATESASESNPTSAATRRANVSTATRTPTRTPTSTPNSSALFLEIEDTSATSLPVQATATPDYAIDFNTSVPPTDEAFEEDPLSGSGSPRVP